MPTAASVIALPPVTGRGAQVPTREPTADLHPRVMRGVGGRPGEIDRMLRGHPVIATGVADLRYGVAAAKVEWQAPEDASPGERLFAETCRSVLMEHVTVDADRPELGGWASVAETLADHWIYGHTVHALRLVGAPGARHPMATLDDLTVEAFPVHSSTVQQWSSTQDGRRLEYVRQQTYAGAAQIPAESLVITQHGGALGEYEGLSVLRPLVFLFERWVSVWASAERNAYFAGGVMMTFAPPAANAQDTADLEDAQVAWMTGVQPILNLPHPWTGDRVVLSYPAGTPPDVRAQAEYIDGQITQSMGRAVMSLGYTAHGSHALSETMAAADAWTSHVQLDLLLTRWSRGAAAWLARQVGYRGRLPVLGIINDEQPDMDQRVTTVGTAVREGLVRWTGDDEASMREQLGLSPIAERAQVQASHTGCCDHVHLAEPITVTDGEGEPFLARRELTDLESHVRLSRIERTMQQLGDEVTAAIERIADEHRAAAWSALAGGYDPTSLAATYDTYRDRYAAQVDTYARAVETVVIEEAERELRSQERDGLPESNSAAPVPSEGNTALDRLPARVQVVSETIASRVQGEIEQAWTDGVTPAGWSSRITPNGLSQGARSVGERILAEGRVAIGDALAPGVRIIEVERTDIRDQNQCSHCRSLSGRRFRLPEQLAEYQAMPLPDPECEGGSERCRCGWLVRWGRVADV